MSEFARQAVRRHDLHWQLLTTVSALALAVSATGEAQADDASRPSVWIELGGQLDQVSGALTPFSAPFLTTTPTPGPFTPKSPLEAQKPSRFSFGGEGKISFRPDNTNWVFSAGIRYGRSSSEESVHKQTQVPEYKYIKASNSFSPINRSAAKFATTDGTTKLSYAVVDFQAGRDVGLGMFGREGSSTISLGVRFAQFASKSHVEIKARPNEEVRQYEQLPGFYPQAAYFNNYYLNGDASRSFHGVGPSLSWDGSAPVIGDADSGEIALDWGVKAAVLFGRQSVDVQQESKARYYAFRAANGFPAGYTTLYDRTPHDVRKRSVVVPNIGGFAGASFKFPNAKVSLGYRADIFFGAADMGAASRRTQDLSFHGPYATISIGLGG
jgi:hypothetical protein